MIHELDYQYSKIYSWKNQYRILFINIQYWSLGPPTPQYAQAPVEASSLQKRRTIDQTPQNNSFLPCFLWLIFDHLDPDTDQGFDDQKLEKINSWKNFFDQN